MQLSSGPNSLSPAKLHTCVTDNTWTAALLLVSHPAWQRQYYHNTLTSPLLASNRNDAVLFQNSGLVAAAAAAPSASAKLVTHVEDILG